MKIVFNLDSIKSMPGEIKKMIWFLGMHAFIVILFLVLIDIILGGIIFYNYVFLAEQKTPQTHGNALKFDNKTYQEVIEKLQSIEQNNLK